MFLYVAERKIYLWSQTDLSTWDFFFFKYTLPRFIDDIEIKYPFPLTIFVLGMRAVIFTQLPLLSHMQTSTTHSLSLVFWF